MGGKGSLQWDPNHCHIRYSRVLQEKSFQFRRSNLITLYFDQLLVHINKYELK